MEGIQRMVNREAVPLAIGLCIPLSLVAIVLVQSYGIDFISFIKSLDVLYYIAIFPILLGLIVAIANRNK
ncbi:MAG: hypothetical protein KGY65_00145 [Candidatus Thermoplasmatota archaeon]|nr:hypothetical protein [Candidatus Thermoplasmatota archaeon]MBS3801141.1 hypothetical protein [Candidatus Thermoplasmatota archaeon]